MPKPDECEVHIIHALQKEGWQVTHRNYFIDDDASNRLYIDLVASTQSNGTVERTIFVEVKCFRFSRSTPELHRALGQYITYRVILDREGFTDPLYLVVPLDTYDDYFNAATLAVVQRYGIKLMVVDLETERIVEWQV